MNPEIKKKWLDALRSGEYQQGKRLLKTEDGRFCCLGVLCDLYLKEKGRIWADNFRLASKGVLPKEVCEWAGLDIPNPIIKQYQETFHTAAEFNDIGYTFKQIADLIEQKL